MVPILLTDCRRSIFRANIRSIRSTCSIFPSPSDNTAGLQSYGATNGYFGTRSSGTGLYDVSSSFRFVKTVTNDNAFAQTATLTFEISPGFILNALGTQLTGSEFVTSGLNFDVRRDGSQVWAVRRR